MASPPRPRARDLRQATFIIPSTGERVRRVFSLRDAAKQGRRQTDETEPLLQNGNARKRVSKRTNALRTVKQQSWSIWQFIKSNTGQQIFKCSLAYLLGSLATFIPFIANTIGRGDSKHMVATVTVYFHPARSVGSMHEAVVLALLAFCYATVVSFSSMGFAVAFAGQGLLFIGHMFILLIFCGGGLGLIAWTKQYFAHPLVNVACSLASLGTITTLVKEGSIQDGLFSARRMTQILVMVLLGVIVSTLVNLLVLPVKARKKLHDDIAKATDLQGEMLINITRAFLAGEESILREGQQIRKDNTACMGSMSKNLTEAQKEYYVYGREQQYRIEAQLVRCLNRLSQDLGGLRSAASTQFSILAGGFEMHNTQSSTNTVPSSPAANGQISRRGSVSRVKMLDVITEDPEEMETVPPSIESSWFAQDPPSPDVPFSPLPILSPSSAKNQPLGTNMPDRESLSPADMFVAFINQLGPPAKSLAYTLKQIFDISPFNDDGSISVNDRFHPSLERAIELYRQSRADALESLYRSRALSNQRSSEILADLEEVAASCGHFSFSLLDFAEDALQYLQLLDDLKIETEQSPKRSWNWLMFWRRQSADDESPIHTWPQHDENGDPHANIPSSLKKIDRFADNRSFNKDRPLTWRLHRALSFLRRDDIRFAIKVGIGAIIFAFPAFLPESRPVFHEFRGEWGLVSYMVVCSMTIGASNTTGFQRFLGTCIGAGLAVLTWLISNHAGVANPYLLAFLGWLVSTGCFYIILAQGKGPMGRFILLTYNLGALYAYSLSMKDDDDDDDEGGIDPAIWGIIAHRVTSVIAGTIWAVFITRIVWPISARKKFQDGLCVLWLRMGLIWKRDPLAMFLLGEPKSSYMDIREEAELQGFLTYLDSLRQAAVSEFELRGPFPDKVYGRIVETTRQMLECFHAMNVVIQKQLQCTPGEANVLRHTRDERFALSARISHLFSVLASSLKLEYPLNDVLPNIEDKRDKLLTKLFEFRRSKTVTNDADFELFYAYSLVTGQLAEDIQSVIREIEMLFGVLDEDNLKLQ